ncbi:MAG: single-stranded DNA-binding protein [Bacilli bacterium]|nr:single-stranded DNA-binding protein [Bacilli bacterium]
MNKVFLIGRLTRDPDLRYGSSNNAIMRASLAVDRTFTNQSGEREADFVSIVAFGNRAETMKKYLTKGSQIAVSGRIQTGSYDDKDGKRVYTTDVVIDEFQFLDSRNSRQGDMPSQPADSSNSSPESGLTPYDFSETMDSSNNDDIDPFKDFGDKVEIDDSDLPF